MLKKCLIWGGTTLSTLLFTTGTLAGDGYYDNSYGNTDQSFNLQTFQYQKHEDNGYARDGKSLYIYGGYYFAYRFLNDETFSLFNGNNPPPTTVTVKNDNFPSMSNNLELGFGKQLTRHIDIQFAYTHQLKKSKKNITTSVNKNTASLFSEAQGGKVNLLYILDPYGQFQIAPLMGISIDSIDQTITIPSASNKTFTRTLLEGNLSIGIELSVYFTQSFALRLNGQYTIGSNIKRSDGQISVFSGISYTLN